MTRHKYVGMDVHSATTVIDVQNEGGKTVATSTIETKAEPIKDFIRGMTGTIHVTFEEGVHAAWLYEIIKPLVGEVIVCNPNHNKLIRSGNKSDRNDAQKLAELLRLGSLKAVYHGDCGTRRLREAVRAYNALTGDCLRVMNRIKAMYMSRGVDCKGTEVYQVMHREQWLDRLGDPPATVRLGLLYEQFDSVSRLREMARIEMVNEVKSHPAYKVLKQVKTLGPVRIAEIIAVVRSPFRFRTKRQFWPYCGLAVRTASSGDYVIVNGNVRRKAKRPATRGLNSNYNREMKKVFKGAALQGTITEPFKQYYEGLTARGMKPEMARLTLARKIAAITLTVWKKGERFDAGKVIQG
jgi:transposase